MRSSVAGLRRRDWNFKIIYSRWKCRNSWEIVINIGKKLYRAWAVTDVFIRCVFPFQIWRHIIRKVRLCIGFRTSPYLQLSLSSKFWCTKTTTNIKIKVEAPTPLFFCFGRTFSLFKRDSLRRPCLTLITFSSLSLFLLPVFLSSPTQRIKISSHHLLSTRTTRWLLMFPIQGWSHISNTAKKVATSK